jgi:hypothetical protein
VSTHFCNILLYSFKFSSNVHLLAHKSKLVAALVINVNSLSDNAPNVAPADFKSISFCNDVLANILLYLALKSLQSVQANHFLPVLIACKSFRDIFSISVISDINVCANGVISLSLDVLNHNA